MLRARLSVNQKQIEIDRARIRKTARKILSALGYSDAELSVVVVDDEEMASLNREYRQVDSTTDVLSFPMLEGEYGDVEPGLLGDVVISAPTALLMAERQGIPFQAVVDLLLVHGTLHLLGHDHGSMGEAREMDEKTLEILKKLGHSEEIFSWYMTSGRLSEDRERPGH